ncbi:hypothetical protein J3458_001898 [Metarhizium acridum]|uniref:uncharacterized protein n=1 Tax=Metarhizium acridum TaxID=92637 RepID=UPI001C6B32A5|nr:hypothetical protein J3458_001898 [Metarhizium acridum]
MTGSTMRQTRPLTVEAHVCVVMLWSCLSLKRETSRIPVKARISNNKDKLPGKGCKTTPRRRGSKEQTEPTETSDTDGAAQSQVLFRAARSGRKGCLYNVQCGDGDKAPS